MMPRVQACSERLTQTWNSLLDGGRKALIPYVTGGDPDLDTTAALIRTLGQSGADVIEVGIPFSDPIADGPAVQRASHRALTGGATVAAILEAVRRARPAVEQPILAMVYYNSIFHYGETRFMAQAAASGLDGLIVPDLPLEEATATQGEANAAGLDLIYLVAPTTPDRRLEETARRTTAFLYAVSVTGVTGVRAALPTQLEAFLRRIRAVTDSPVAVGFGIGSGDQARRVAALADGVIVGSAIVDRLGAASDPAAGIEAACSFVRELRAALDAPSGVPV